MKKNFKFYGYIELGDYRLTHSSNDRREVQHTLLQEYYTNHKGEKAEIAILNNRSNEILYKTLVG